MVADRPERDQPPLARALRGSGAGTLNHLSRRRGADRERGVLRNLDPDIAQRQTGHSARHPPDGLPVVLDLLAGGRRLDLEHAQPPIDVPAMAEACDRLLARIAALREG